MHPLAEKTVTGDDLLSPEAAAENMKELRQQHPESLKFLLPDELEVILSKPVNQHHRGHSRHPETREGVHKDHHKAGATPKTIPVFTDCLVMLRTASLEHRGGSTTVGDW